MIFGCVTFSDHKLVYDKRRTLASLPSCPMHSRLNSRQFGTTYCVWACARTFARKEKGRVYTTSAAVLGLIFRENTKGSTSPEAKKKKKKTATKQSRVYVEKTKKTCTHIQARERPLCVLGFFSGCVCRIVSVRTRHGWTANSMLEKLATR